MSVGRLGDHEPQVNEWSEVFGPERLTGALLDRFTHHEHIFEMNGDDYRLKGNRQSTSEPYVGPPAEA